MDHKTLFTFHGHQTPNDCMELTIEEIYQAFESRLLEKLASLGIVDYKSIKARMIEEVSTEGRMINGKYTFYRLIDTTEPSNER